ncbi:uncharacterized protein B0I36DRAFT_246866 [Microdochium trichocladiopsis]|uniref:Uncharacterized protein n=1 Tax=Microdochium trichocladiopsis TaxID=1682393 RepID=A0A9P9BNE7_9PEZI|nr:uncharacterized protein B0I36DRAFT_246866 [Microdochium trichocladiopsis]KAH7027641.1 hypothetical protein B0I36DRAFT_246866 [Microdochium trichocladiopsis]
MPEFFPFIPGTEASRAARQHAADSSPLLGRFRAVPRTRNSPRSHAQNQLGLLGGPGGRGSVHVGYGALVTAGLEEGDRHGSRPADDSDSDSEDDTGLLRRQRRFWRTSCRRLNDVWISPRQTAVKRAVDTWWGRWGNLVFLPAGLAIAWCSIPFPQYPLDPQDPDHIPGPPSDSAPSPGHRAPGHGEARVQVNFWFFLFVYYGFYNLTALIWITKVFNLYSLNWWPSSLGFPLTISLIAAVSILGPIPLYIFPETRFLTVHNTAWISWTFLIMALPVGIAFWILMTHERHLGLRHSLSETQRIFTSSWWTGDTDTMIPARGSRGHLRVDIGAFDPHAGFEVSTDQRGRHRHRPALAERRRWLPASFVRFVWFCLALLVGLFAYLIGEAYAEIYLRTLPHNNFETIAYVYSWIVTVHLLDMLTGWILGASEDERVGSYPLSWIFKLYFMLTYQTYVRALYARLRSPEQFIWLQALSSGFLIILTPIQMTPLFHRILCLLGLTGQSYGSYLKLQTRNVFIRFLAENVSMITFLGSILVLHYGPNKDVYPYFAFDGTDKYYDFDLTMTASVITWACELVAGIVLRALIRWFFGVDATAEGKLDLAVWPELLPTAVAAMLHVLQNMMFSIIRLHFG